MRRFWIYALLGALLSSYLPAIAQEKSNASDESTKSGDHEDKGQLRVQINITEYEGDKKVKSLPYVLLVQPGDGPGTRIRMGTRTPVASGPESSSSQYQYVDVGTNLDCRAKAQSDGRYRLDLSVDRSWVEGDVFVPILKAAGTPNDSSVGKFAQPIIHQFRSSSYTTIREGQSQETTLGTDPVSGKVSKIEVTITVVK